MRDVTHSKDHPRDEDWDEQTIRHRCTSVGVVGTRVSRVSRVRLQRQRSKQAVP